MRLKLFLISVLAMISILSSTMPALSSIQKADARTAKAYGKLPLSFVENRGQLDKRARYVINGPRASAFFRNDGVTFDLWDASKKVKQDNKPEMREHAVLKLTFKGADAKCRVKGTNQLPGKVNYMTSNDRSKWHTNIPTYKGVVYKNVWKGIDIIYRGDRNQLKYDIRVNPGADIRKVRLQYDGAEKIWLDEKGDLHIKTAVTEFIEKVPGIYHEKSGKKIDRSGGYKLLSKNTVGFDVKNVDPKLPLVIDPTANLVYATLLGGASEGQSIAVDSSGCAYITGMGGGPVFPVTSGAFRTIWYQNDTYVAKFNSAGDHLVYCTYIGITDFYVRIAVDPSGCAYIAGVVQTVSEPTPETGFPITPGAFDTTFDGVKDSFVMKLNASGSGLVYSTLLGGTSAGASYWESITSITVDAEGYAYVTGYTGSADFPTTSGAFDTTFSGGRDAFITKLNQSGSALVYSTFLGGASDEDAKSIAIDSAGCAYVAGWTGSSDFPTTLGAYDRVKNGASDAFVTKINASGSGLLYSTFLGGNDLEGSNDPERATSIAIDSSSCAYVAGYTSSVDFPVTPGSYDTTLAGHSDAFITKLNMSGSALLYSTYLGGDETDIYSEVPDDYISSISVDSAGGIYLAGWTYASDFPTTEDALTRTFVGEYDGFVAKLSIPENALIYSTFMNGLAYSITLDSSGYVYVTGNSYYPDTEIDYGTIISNALSGGASIIKFDMRSLKPDLLIKNGTESVYTGEGIVNDDGTSQTKSQNATTGQKITYAFKIKNGGNVDDAYTIIGSGGEVGWSVKYYDLATNADITSQIVGTGWTTGELSSGETAGFYAKVTADGSVSTGSINTLLVTAISITDPLKIDVVKAVTTVVTANCQPDLLIKTDAESSFSGDGIFSTDGSNQTKSQNTSANLPAGYSFLAKNAGNVNDSFKITGPGGGSGWTVRYYDIAASTDITSQVTGIGWTTGTLAPGASVGIYCAVTPNTSVSTGSAKTLLITAASIVDSTKTDSVKAVTSVVVSYKADLLIKTGAESTYTGTGIINTDGSNQTKSQNAIPGQRRTYAIRIQNAGTGTDTFTISAPGGGNGWTVKYYELPSNADITSQVTGSGWTTGILAPGAYKGLYVNVTPNTAVPAGSVNTLLISSVSTGDSTKTDVIKAVTTFISIYKPDLLIKTGYDATYSGTGIYSTDGSNQIKSQNALPGQRRVYGFSVRNAGNANDSFTITAPAGGSGWTVRYYERITNVDITSLITGSGFTTPPLAPGTSKEIYAFVTPDAAAVEGATMTLLVSAVSLSDGAKQDVVKAVTTVIPPFKPDLLIKTGPEALYSGTGIFSLDGDNQTKSQNAVSGQKVTYLFRAKNAGNSNDTLKIKGTGGGSGWTVKYFSIPANTDITSQVTGSGWSTGILAPGIYSGLYVQVTPDGTIPTGSSKTLLITATSVGDSTKVDVVKAITTVP